jgi:hypothetical protein
MIRARAYVHCYRGFSLFAFDLRNIASWRGWYSRWLSPLFNDMRDLKSCWVLRFDEALLLHLGRRTVIGQLLLWTLVSFWILYTNVKHNFTVCIYAYAMRVLKVISNPSVSSVGSSRISTMSPSLHKRQHDVEDTSALLMHSRSTYMHLGSNRRDGMEQLQTLARSDGRRNIL